MTITHQVTFTVDVVFLFSDPDPETALKMAIRKMYTNGATININTVAGDPIEADFCADQVRDLIQGYQMPSYTWS